MWLTLTLLLVFLFFFLEYSWGSPIGRNFFTSWHCFLFLRQSKINPSYWLTCLPPPRLTILDSLSLFDAPFVKNFKQSQIHLVCGSNSAQETHIHHLTQENYGVQPGLNTITSCLLLQDTLLLLFFSFPFLMLPSVLTFLGLLSARNAFKVSAWLSQSPITYFKVKDVLTTFSLQEMYSMATNLQINALIGSTFSLQTITVVSYFKMHYGIQEP